MAATGRRHDGVDGAPDRQNGKKNKVTSRFTVLMVVGSRQDQLFYKEFKS
jgi:hypothetical protein